MAEKTHCKEEGCEECKKRAEMERRAEEVATAFLIALMPLMTLTLFGNIGLI